MKFDWRRFCDKYSIPYVTAGPNTAQGNISIHCPWCGTADESEHLGLSLKMTTPSWGCWRSSSHRGRDPTRLVQKLLSISLEQARAYVTVQDNALIDDFDVALEKWSKKETVEKTVEKKLVFPSEARPLWKDTIGDYHRKYLEYLEDRGFTKAADVARRFQLHYALIGPYKQRVLIPLYEQNPWILAGWTARSIRADDPLRYKTSNGLPDYILFHSSHNTWEELKKGCPLIIVEGPFDAMKVSCYSQHLTVVALLGVSLTRAKFLRIVSLAKAARTVVMLLDPDILQSNFDLADRLYEVTGKKPYLGKLPPTVKDPGDLTAKHVRSLEQEWLALPERHK